MLSRRVSGHISRTSKRPAAISSWPTRIETSRLPQHLRRNIFFAGKDREFEYTRDTPTSRKLQDFQLFYRLRTWGFVVYRCTYTDDAAWQAFLERFHGTVHDYFASSREDSSMLQTFDYQILDDPSLQDASKDEVRRRFRTWAVTEAKRLFPHISSDEELDLLTSNIPRLSYCIHVDEECMRSVLAANDDNHNGQVALIRADGEWFRKGYPDFKTFDWSKYVEPEDEGLALGHDEEIEGCRLHDVGWLKLGWTSIVEAYIYLADVPWRWDNIYKRPYDDQDIVGI